MGSVMSNLAKEIDEKFGIKSGDTFIVVHNYIHHKETIEYLIVDVIENTEDYSVLVNVTDGVLTEYTGDNQEVAFGMFLEENRLNIERVHYGGAVFSQNITKEFVEEEKLKEKIRLVTSYAEVGDVIYLETYRGKSRYLILDKLTSNGGSYETKGYTLVNLLQRCTTFRFGDTIEELIESLIEKEGKVLDIRIENVYTKEKK